MTKKNNYLKQKVSFLKCVSVLTKYIPTNITKRKVYYKTEFIQDAQKEINSNKNPIDI